MHLNPFIYLMHGHCQDLFLRAGAGAGQGEQVRVLAGLST
jgi:hypothetical protein